VKCLHRELGGIYIAPAVLQVQQQASVSLAS
jgi:hypothetical protein